MCDILAASGTLADAADLLRDPESAIVDITTGADLALFNAEPALFNIPHSLVFTLRLRKQGAIVWAGIFAFDLLRETSRKWSPIQEVSRCLADHFRCDADGEFYKGGGRFVTQLMALAPEGADLLRRMNLGLGADAAEWEQVMSSPIFATRRATLQRVKFSDVLRKAPSEFRVYHTYTYTHDQYDYRGCCNRLVFRIVSKPTAEHQVMYEYRVHAQGFRTIDVATLARGFSSHIKSQLRKEKLAAKEFKPAIDAWSRHAWAELTGKTPAEHAICALADNTERCVAFVLGRESVSGLVARRWDVPFSEIHDVAARNNVVSIKFTLDEPPKREKVLFKLRCVDVEAARKLVTALAAGAVPTISRSKNIPQIAAFFGEPVRSAVFLGHRRDEEESLVREFESAVGTACRSSPHWTGRELFISRSGSS